MATQSYNTSHVSVANAATESGEVDLRGRMLLAVQPGTEFDGTTMSFLAAEKPTRDGGVYGAVNYLNVLDAVPFAITGIAAGDHVVIPGSILPQGIGNCMLKLTVGAQTGATDFILYTRPV